MSQMIILSDKKLNFDLLYEGVYGHKLLYYVHISLIYSFRLKN